MTIQLRQICLVAEKLEPVINDLTSVLGINPCYVDPGVGYFGLENTLMPVGHNFLEVVAPIKEGTAASRYLSRRQGDGGYMVITQAASQAVQQAARKRALENGVRVAHESEREGWGLCQLHPGDMEAAFLELEWDSDHNFDGKWMPAGGLGWQEKVNQSVTVDYLGVELQAVDPLSLAEKWARVIGVDVTREANEYQVPLNNVTLRFVEVMDDRGPGLSGLDIAVSDRLAILVEAEKRNLLVNDHQVDICGTHFYLKENDS